MKGKAFYSMAFVLVSLLPALAQGPPPATPIDGGLSVLLVAGGIYGLKRLRDHKSQY